MRELGSSLVTVGVQDLDVVVRAELVREVLGPRQWVAIPGARREIPGVLLWAGQAVAVLDLARFQAGLAHLGPGQTRPRTVLVSVSDSLFGLPVDRVSEVWSLHEDNLQPRQLHDFELAKSEAVIEERVLPLLEPELLFECLGVGV